MARIRIAAAQTNLVVGDLVGNAERIRSGYGAALAADCDVVAFPELAVTAYPPEDLLLKPAFVAEAVETVRALAKATEGPALVVGFPDGGPELRNAAALCAHGAILGVYAKEHLPNYAVFDEQRYFVADPTIGPLFRVNGVCMGLTICEDAWEAGGPILAQAEAGAEVMININASPYSAGRVREREAMLAARAREARVPIVYVNLVGGQDELVFDGASMATDAEGNVVARARQFAEDLLVVDIDLPERQAGDRSGGAAPGAVEPIVVSEARSAPTPVAPRMEPLLDPLPEIYEALMLGTRDYVSKNGFTDVLIGLSGGIDSSLVATIAVDALGPERVVGVLMPSRYSSEHSITDAETLATNLGIRIHTIPIDPTHAAFSAALAPVWSGADHELADENLQARIRGTLLMSLSNTYGWLVLTTGNKSEYATGYTTLYGDMAGGFAVLKDVAKTQVFALAHDRNARAGRPLIPEHVLAKPPSAELRPEQEDEASLMPYAQLDQILAGYIEDDLSVRELIDAGFPEEAVRRVAGLVDRNEYKRRQAPPGVRVSPKAFGKDRRLPITNRWPG